MGEKKDHNAVLWLSPGAVPGHLLLWPLFPHGRPRHRPVCLLVASPSFQRPRPSSSHGHGRTGSGRGRLVLAWEPWISSQSSSRSCQGRASLLCHVKTADGWKCEEASHCMRPGPAEGVLQMVSDGC